ncbi:ABC transporter ATP-binding protein [Clostridium formicaceticum]|uniref:ABC transporter ATP-binding protein n=1 Tax=Clostridium formicaceticum TaxID=1497 RepID=A0AAC9RMY6_9CLOT|nr:ATP-binding cassette domain-containing protein [Clostridium formicaceticum]AOY78011.1 ABC transporter ATP-binding protein [Clostridium formicaceticum]ARE88644.1 Methionine import ATP-binding protein MetN [Clostridium formicaceticum]
MLDLKNVSKTFYPGTANEKRALNSLNLHLDSGDFVTIIGSNGAGKSTLFGAIAGAYYIDSGVIMLDNKNITGLADYKRAYDIGRLMQDPMKGTAPSMTIEENLALAYTRKAKKSFFALNKKDSSYFRELLTTLDLGLEDRMKTKVGHLSGGQRQAVTLLMCTISSPKLLLLDEHTAALDPLTAQKILKITTDIIAESKITTMMITHDIQAALSFGNRTIMMDAGEIILDIKGEKRSKMTVEELLLYYSKERKKQLVNDRMLLA